MSDAGSSDTSLEAEARKNLRASLRYAYAMTQLVGADTSTCLDHKTAAHKRFNQTHASADFSTFQFWLRALVRAAFAEVEVTTFVLRQVLLWAHDRGELSLTSAEISLLREETYNFDLSRKQIRVKSAFNRLLENLVLRFTLVPRLAPKPHYIAFNNTGWEAFQRAVKLRDAITHPKSPEEFVIGVEAAGTFRKGLQWFHDSLKELYGQFLQDP